MVLSLAPSFQRYLFVDGTLTIQSKLQTDISYMLPSGRKFALPAMSYACCFVCGGWAFQSTVVLHEILAVNLFSSCSDKLTPAPSAKLLEEKCDFQRSMANNEAKLKENEDDFRLAQRGFVADLEKANLAYSRNR